MWKLIICLNLRLMEVTLSVAKIVTENHQVNSSGGLKHWSTATPQCFTPPKFYRLLPPLLMSLPHTCVIFSICTTSIKSACMMHKVQNKLYSSQATWTTLSSQNLLLRQVKDPLLILRTHLIQTLNCSHQRVLQQPTYPNMAGTSTLATLTLPTHTWLAPAPKVHPLNPPKRGWQQHPSYFHCTHLTCGWHQYPSYTCSTHPHNMTTVP